MTASNPDARLSSSSELNCPPRQSLSDEDGAIPIASGATTVSGSFRTQKINTNYSFEVGYIENTVDVDPLSLSWTLTNKTVTGFTVKLDSITDTANYIFRYRIRVIT